MARQDFLNGGYRGKLGQTVGSLEHGKYLVRVYSKPTNPKTPVQQQWRSVFRQALRFMQIGLSLTGHRGFFPSPSRTEANRRTGYACTSIKKALPWDQCLLLEPRSPGQERVAFPLVVRCVDEPAFAVYWIPWVTEDFPPTYAVVAGCLPSGVPAASLWGQAALLPSGYEYTIAPPTGYIDKPELTTEEMQVTYSMFLDASDTEIADLPHTTRETGQPTKPLLALQCWRWAITWWLTAHAQKPQVAYETLYSALDPLFPVGEDARQSIPQYPNASGSEWNVSNMTFVDYDGVTLALSFTAPTFTEARPALALASVIAHTADGKHQLVEASAAILMLPAAGGQVSVHLTWWAFPLTHAHEVYLYIQGLTESDEIDPLKHSQSLEIDLHDIAPWGEAAPSAFPDSAPTPRTLPVTQRALPSDIGAPPPAPEPPEPKPSVAGGSKLRSSKKKK